VDLERRVWRTRDGKGGYRPGGLYLTDDLLEAWRVFIAADAFGPFNTGSMARVLRTAGWPEDVRPYALRSSLGIALSESGADLADVASVLGHTSTDMTRSHYVPVIGSRLQAALERVGTRIG
jgi:integrase